jgi:4-amino-4-deoxy-L-arabinose transferase-like glycosyltransferase
MMLRVANLLDTRRPRLLLTLFCLVLWAPGFFTIPPGDRDESRFAQATKQMIETGDFVRIQNGLEARNRKPIGIHWLQVPFAAAARGLGVARENPIWPYRIPSALGGLAAVLATFWVGERLVGRRAALLGAGMLAASVILVVEVHIAKTDAALLGATTVAMAVLGWAYLAPDRVRTGQAAVFWLAVGAGILLKGPITPMVAGLTAASLAVADRRAGWLRALRPGWGVPLMAAVVLPWFVAIGVATEGRFFADAVGGDLGRKLSSGDDTHWGPPGLHLLLLPLLLFPASAALPGAAVAAWRGRAAAPTRLLIAWIVPAWIVFEAVPTKLPHYTLPLLPAVCLLAAGWVVELGRRAAVEWVGATLFLLAAALLGVGALAAPEVLHLGIWLGAPAAVAVLACSFLLWERGGVRRAPRETPGNRLEPSPVREGVALQGSLTPALSQRERGQMLLLAAVVPFYWAVLGLELPRLAPLWLAPRVVAAMPGMDRLGAVGFAEPSLMFLAGTDTQWLLAADAPKALASGRIHTLLVGDRDRAAVVAEAAREGVPLQQVAEVDGLNYSRGRPVALTLFRLGP